MTSKREIVSTVELQPAVVNLQQFIDISRQFRLAQVFSPASSIFGAATLAATVSPALRARRWQGRAGNAFAPLPPPG